MIYYAIRNKETKLYLTINRLTGQYEYTSKEIIPYLLQDKGCANIYIEGDNSIEAVPVELKETIEEPLAIKLKPKWYEIKKNQMVSLDKVEAVDLLEDRIKVSAGFEQSKYKTTWRVKLCCGKYDYETSDLTKEEATAKYNELKKLLEEV